MLSLLAVVAENCAPDHAHMDRVWLNNLPLDRTWMRHWEIEKRGVARFEMVPEPVSPERAASPRQREPAGKENRLAFLEKLLTHFR